MSGSSRGWNAIDPPRLGTTHGRHHRHHHRQRLDHRIRPAGCQVGESESHLIPAARCAAPGGRLSPVGRQQRCHARPNGSHFSRARSAAKAARRHAEQGNQSGGYANRRCRARADQSRRAPRFATTKPGLAVAVRWWPTFELSSRGWRRLKTAICRRPLALYRTICQTG